ncbi:helix-turn-helix domain-containing protein [Proteus sp. FME41]|uniref:helix-turn-helix domain-containing protein n=1 Tax=Proteus sp. FME41 TaxID=2742608 RepID=UPI00186603C7|nr:helix-turn-helix transcriptional regulator [Proteus sp. FME41]
MNKEISKLVGAKIRELRKTHSMSGSEFGALLGISQQHQSRFENGESNIHAESIYILSYLFDLDLSYFFDEVKKITGEGKIDHKKNHYKSESIIASSDIWR